MSSFNSDLLKGQEWEDEAVQLLNWTHSECSWHRVDEGKFPYYDLRCDHCGYTIECKLDGQSARTGNFVFEENLFNYSTADYLLYKAGDDIYLLQLHGLQAVLDRMLLMEHPDFGLLQGGDGLRQSLYTCRVNTLTAMGIAKTFDIRIRGTELPF